MVTAGACVDIKDGVVHSNEPVACSNVQALN
jgi:hypothetical protein